MKHTLSILVENHAGVLSRVSGLFSRRAFNIESLAVGVTDDPAVSRITIVVDGTDYTVEQIEKQLNKLIDVIKVRTIPAPQLLERELALIKVFAADADTRKEIMNITDLCEAKIVDISPKTLTVQILGESGSIERFCAMLAPDQLCEIVRTGLVALEKGENALKL